jgi:branched-chain amino acid transport system substrate-binding protein
MVRARGLAVLISAAFFAFACGGSTGGGGSKGEIDIASELPTSGNETSSGLPTQQGAAFAISSLASGTYHGFTIKFVPFDDAVNGAHDPQKGVQNVQSMIANSKILGMVGPFNSSVAKAEIPVANQAPLVMISPSNTNECLTQALSYCQQADGFTAASLRPSGTNNYFRIAAADTFQGPAMADFANKAAPAGLGLTKVAVWDDEETFGAGVAGNFVKEWTKLGGTVVDRKSYDPKSKSDFHDFLASALNKGAQGIYVGATSPTKGCIARGEMTAAQAASIYYLGPDGDGDAQCIKDAGANANDHMYATQGVADATQNPSAKTIIAAYSAAYPGASNIGAYTFGGYDCAAIILDSIGRAIDANGGNMPSRAQVIAQVAKTSNFAGLTGVITFDANGDPTHPTLQLQQVKSGAWAFVTQISQGA